MNRIVSTSLLVLVLARLVAGCAEDRPPPSADLAARDQRAVPVTKAAGVDASADLDGGTDRANETDGDASPRADASPEAAPIDDDPAAICAPTLTLGQGTLVPRSTNKN